jgi:hypothetical protein
MFDSMLASDGAFAVRCICMPIPSIGTPRARKSFAMR